MRRLPLDFRDQYFGCEIELTGINRATAAQTLADLFGTRAEHSGGGYDAYRVKDLDGKEWKIVRDGSIHPECRRRSVLIGETYKVELNSPKLEYGEMEKLQEVVRSLRRAGGIVNDSCGMHVHVDASKHTPQSLKNVLSIMYSKEDILFAALKVNPARIDSYCQAVDEPILEEIRKLPSGASMDQLKDRWYRGRDGSDYHYHQSRYHAFYAQKKVMVCKCGGKEFFTEEHGNQTGLYCSACGKWQKWLKKDEIRLFNHGVKVENASLLERLKARIEESAIKVSTVKAPHTYMKAVGTRELKKILEEELGNEDTKRHTC